MARKQWAVERMRELAKESGLGDTYVDRVFLRSYSGCLPDEAGKNSELNAIRIKFYLPFKTAALLAEEKLEKRGLLAGKGFFHVSVEPSCNDRSVILMTYKRNTLLFGTLHEAWRMQGMREKMLEDFVRQTASRVESEYCELISQGVIKGPDPQLQSGSG